MAIFGFGKKGDESAEKAKEAPVVYSPENAAKFFQRATTIEESEQFEYALQMWLSGLRWDPHSMTGTEGFFRTVAKFLASGKKSVSKEVLSAISGKADVDKYLRALLEWGLEPGESVKAVAAFEHAAKVGVTEPAYWIGERAFGFVTKDKKPRKELAIKVSEAFGKIGAFDKSVAAAEFALKLDPTDNELSASIRALAAQATMSRGGYDKKGEGGFRSNIRDADKQRKLDDENRIVKTEATIDRIIADCEEELKQRPTDQPTIDKLCKHLLERAKPADEARAAKMLMDSFEGTKAFRYRELAGDLKMRQQRRKITELKKMIEGAPEGDAGQSQREMVQRMLDEENKKLLDLELMEFKLRVEAYPTDLSRKFELAKRYFAAGNHHDAIELLQEAQSDPRVRVQAGNMLGLSFQAIGYLEEAVHTFRTALEVQNILPDTALEINYNLMVALADKAAEHRDLASAEEADKIASKIAMQQFGYRDIRVRRDGVKKLIGELRAQGKA